MKAILRSFLTSAQPLVPAYLALGGVIVIAAMLWLVLEETRCRAAARE
jgi:hypothetical protein